jgi:hypothetical protein
VHFKHLIVHHQTAGFVLEQDTQRRDNIQATTAANPRPDALHRRTVGG